MFPLIKDMVLKSSAIPWSLTTRNNLHSSRRGRPTWSHNSLSSVPTFRFLLQGRLCSLEPSPQLQTLLQSRPSLFAFVSAISILPIHAKLFQESKVTDEDVCSCSTSSGRSKGRHPIHILVPQSIFSQHVQPSTTILIRDCRPTICLLALASISYQELAALVRTSENSRCVQFKYSGASLGGGRQPAIPQTMIESARLVEQRERERERERDLASAHRLNILWFCLGRSTEESFGAFIEWRVLPEKHTKHKL